MLQACGRFLARCKFLEPTVEPQEAYSQATQSSTRPCLHVIRVSRIGRLCESCEQACSRFKEGQVALHPTSGVNKRLNNQAAHKIKNIFKNLTPLIMLCSNL